jgi:hypothetical protein
VPADGMNATSKKPPAPPDGSSPITLYRRSYPRRGVFPVLFPRVSATQRGNSVAGISTASCAGAPSKVLVLVLEFVGVEIGTLGADDVYGEVKHL